MSGTTTSRRTEPDRPLLAGAAAGLLLWWSLSPSLPRLPLRPGALASTVVSLALLALALWAAAPLAAAATRRPLVWAATAGAALAAAATLAGWVALANLGKVAAAAGLGLWLAGEVARPRWVVPLGVVAAAVDVLSVAVGPTRALLTEAPRVVGALVVALTWAGYRPAEAFTGLGASDLLFFALFLGVAARSGLRCAASAAAMAAALAATVALALWTTALPALPALVVAFLAVNAGPLWRRAG